MYQVGYVKGEAEPSIFFENPTLKKKGKGCDFVKNYFSHTLMWENDTERAKVLDLANSWALQIQLFHIVSILVFWEKNMLRKNGIIGTDSTNAEFPHFSVHKPISA